MERRENRMDNGNSGYSFGINSIFVLNDDYNGKQEGHLVGKKDESVIVKGEPTTINSIVYVHVNLIARAAGGLVPVQYLKNLGNNLGKILFIVL